MARPRAFDTEAVLNAARDQFWARGYQATSLDDLTAVTGVNKPSLYAAFGDKEALFLQVLGRYHDGVLLMHATLLNRPGPARDAVRGWLLGFLPFCSEGTGARGCLSANTSFEAAVVSPRVRPMIDAFQAAVEAQLHAALTRGVVAGEFDAALEVDHVARALLAAQSGFLVLARGQPPAAGTARAMEQLLSALLG